MNSDCEKLIKDFCFLCLFVRMQTKLVIIIIVLNVYTNKKVFILLFLILFSLLLYLSIRCRIKYTDFNIFKL